MSLDVKKTLFFDLFENRFVIDAELRTRTGFRIGRGRDDSALGSDLPLLKLHDGRLVVPGSSWKGVVRSAAERILRSLAPPGEEIRWACDPFGAPRNPDGQGLMTCLPKASSDDDASPKDRAARERERIKAHVCLACATFGANGLASHVRFADCTFESRSSIRDGVGIDRDLGRAADNIKFDFEVVPPGTPLHLRIGLENVQDWQVGLILTVLDELGDGSVRVGGMGSRGLGWLELVQTTVRQLTLAQVLARDSGPVADPARLQEFRSALVSLQGGH